MRAAELLADFAEAYDLDDPAVVRWLADADTERIAAALSLAVRKSRAPVFARDALERHTIAPGSATDVLLYAAAEWWSYRSDCPGYVEAALMGLGHDALDGARLPPVLPQRVAGTAGRPGASAASCSTRARPRGASSGARGRAAGSAGRPGRG